MKPSIRRYAPDKNRAQPRGRRWGLQLRMTLSYMGTTILVILLCEALIGLAVFLFLTRTPVVDTLSVGVAQQMAHTYALDVELQARDKGLSSRTTFQPGTPDSIPLEKGGSWTPFVATNALSYVASPSEAAPPTFALLVTPDRKVLASSYPVVYPASSPIAQLLPQQAPIILDALAGHPGTLVANIQNERISAASEPILNAAGKPIGSIFIQLSRGDTHASPLYVARGVLWTTPLWSLILAPLGALFGVLTTRGIVRRIHRLADATATFSSGDYTQRVQVRKKDEIGQLEQQFNQMTEQLLAGMEERQHLTEQQARMEERARIEQELQTAQYIQRTLLPKGVPDLPGWRISPFYQPAREVGGDLYDFLQFADGRLGIIIGDVTGKGVPAALIMATTSTMLLTITQAQDSPGEVLARVNDLLHALTPAGMFVTCFYALLDPKTGHLRYANAGHNLPYRYCVDGAWEVRATGMPLGLMPGMQYEENEVVLRSGESMLFYSDGLIEAHNPTREMFGTGRLRAFLEARPDGAPPIEDLMHEFTSFTGESWEQEDDVTLLALQHRDQLSGALI